MRLDNIVKAAVAAGSITILAATYSCSIGPYKHPVYRRTITNHPLPSRHFRSGEDRRRVRHGVVETPHNLRKPGYPGHRPYRGHNHQKKYYRKHR